MPVLPPPNVKSVRPPAPADSSTRTLPYSARQGDETPCSASASKTHCSGACARLSMGCTASLRYHDLGFIGRSSMSRHSAGGPFWLSRRGVKPSGGQQEGPLH